MTYQEFKLKYLKLNQLRTQKITNSLGVKDFYVWMYKNKWFNMKDLTESLLYKTIRTVNNIIQEQLSCGEEIPFPCLMGQLELRKYIPFIGYKDDKLIVKLTVDWEATYTLWYQDEEAFEKRLLVRIPEKEIFKFKYNKAKARYLNKCLFDFQINRTLKSKLKNNIKNGKIDAFLDR